MIIIVYCLMITVLSAMVVAVWEVPFLNSKPLIVPFCKTWGITIVASPYLSQPKTGYVNKSNKKQLDPIS